MTDWCAIVTDLKKHMSYAEIGRRCGAPRSTIHNFVKKNRIEPMYSLGDALLKLHKEYFPLVASSGPLESKDVVYEG